MPIPERNLQLVVDNTKPPEPDSDIHLPQKPNIGEKVISLFNRAADKQPGSATVIEEVVKVLDASDYLYQFHNPYQGDYYDKGLAHSALDDNKDEWLNSLVIADGKVYGLVVVTSKDGQSADMHVLEMPYGKHRYTQGGIVNEQSYTVLSVPTEKQSKANIDGLFTIKTGEDGWMQITPENTDIELAVIDRPMMSGMLNEHWYEVQKWHHDLMSHPEYWAEE
jgi:hypothetical protein